MKIDFRFYDFLHELHLIERYIDMLEKHLPSIVEAERRQLHLSYAQSSPEESPGLDFVEHDLDRGVATRAFAASAIVGTWALYEMSVVSVAGALQKSIGARLSIEDLRGDFHQRSINYFSEILNFRLHIDEATESRLRHLNVVRNAFAHTGGRLRHVPASQLKRLQAAIRATPGLSTDSEYLLIEVEAARYFHEIVRKTLNDVLPRAKTLLRRSRP